mgnify:CR=1 FL=1
MRKNPYEKIRRALFILLVVMLVTAACVIGVMLIKHTHNAEKNKVRETTAGTENVTEKIKETEADTEYYFDEDGYLKVKKIKADGSGSNTENEQDNAPDVRDVSPEDDPNAVFPETTDAAAGQSAEQTQDISQPQAGRHRMQQPDSKVQEKRYDVRRKNCKRISEIFSFNDGNKQGKYFCTL